MNIESGLRGWWGLVEAGDGSVFKQTGAHQVCKAQCEQLRAAVARGDAQQQISDHRGEDLQANGVFGTTEKGADFEMLLEPAKQQFDSPTFAIERGDRAGRALEVVAQGRVGMWRGGGRPGMSVSASFVWRCLSGSAVLADT